MHLNGRNCELQGKPSGAGLCDRARVLHAEMIPRVVCGLVAAPERMVGSVMLKASRAIMELVSGWFYSGAVEMVEYDATRE